MLKQMERNKVMEAAFGGIGLVSLFFLFLWGFAQVVDPMHYALISQVPWQFALASAGVVLICCLGEEKIAALPRQNIKSIKNGRKIFF